MTWPARRAGVRDVQVLADVHQLACASFPIDRPQYMIAINTELGFSPVERWTFFERAVGPT